MYWVTSRHRDYWKKPTVKLQEPASAQTASGGGGQIIQHAEFLTFNWVFTSLLELNEVVSHSLFRVCLLRFQAETSDFNTTKELMFIWQGPHLCDRVSSSRRPPSSSGVFYFNPPLGIKDHQQLLFAGAETKLNVSDWEEHELNIRERDGELRAVSGLIRPSINGTVSPLWLTQTRPSRPARHRKRPLRETKCVMSPVHITQFCPRIEDAEEEDPTGFLFRVKSLRSASSNIPKIRTTSAILQEVMCPSCPQVDTVEVGGEWTVAVCR